MSWNGSFSRMEGSSDRERQSWRDSFNGGRAAGDFTGNVNAGLNAERNAFGGATWSGSSTQMSALELARSRVVTVGPGTRSVVTSSAVPTRGPGVPAVAEAGVVPGPGGGAVVPPLKGKKKLTVTDVQPGFSWEANPWFSDAAEYEDRYGDSELASTAVFVLNLGADTFHNVDRAAMAAANVIDRAAGSWWNNRPVASGHEPWPINPAGSAPVIGW